MKHSLCEWLFQGLSPLLTRRQKERMVDDRPFFFAVAVNFVPYA